MLILAPYAGVLLQLALSRSREYLADAEAAVLMGSPQLMAKALIKIEQHNQRLQRYRFGWPVIKPVQHTLLRTHPPMRERVRRLLDNDNDRILPVGNSAPQGHRPNFIQRLALQDGLTQCRIDGLCP